MGLFTTPLNNDPIGWFRIFATPPQSERVEITMFRGAPVMVTSLATQDPFGDMSATLEFPQITVWDQPGTGDLDWLVPYTAIDIVWHNVGSYNFSWEWEGFIVDESVSVQDTESTYTVECKGALYQLDNYLAKPSYPQRPIPYEHLLNDVFDPVQNPGVNINSLTIEWPTDWNVTVPDFTAGSRYWFLRPYGVTPGQRWTGLASRSTGSWEAKLTSYTQSMLSVMFTEGGGQWTIRKDRGRIPVLYVRQPPALSDSTLLHVQLGNPGVGVQFSRDFSQSANVVYGTGQDVAGVKFSGMKISEDGTDTSYDPFAYAAAVYPDRNNPLYDENITRKEVQIQFPNGMDERQARAVAQAQYFRFADPGYTGSITLTTDPLLPDGTPFPRVLLQAGRGILVQGFRGSDLLVHITAVEVDLADGSVSLTVDSKFRDALTVQEVRARTRDALSTIRLIKPGSFEVSTEDMLLPWSYEEGSGCMPVGSAELFTRLIGNEDFPWTNTLKRYPPSKYPHFYVKIKNAARLTNTNRNWALRNGNTDSCGVPIRFSQQGSIRLSEVVAVDKNGNVLPVRFHMAIYNNSGVGVHDMPRVPSNTVKMLKPTGANFDFSIAGGQHNPFFKDAFEQITASGAQQSDPGYLYHQSVDFQMGWGNYYEPAGYWPGLASRGAPKSGQLRDEQTWRFSTVNKDFDPQNPHMKPWKNGVGMLYAMIYCDDYNGPVYFIGRFYREEPQG